MTGAVPNQCVRQAAASDIAGVDIKTVYCYNGTGG